MFRNGLFLKPHGQELAKAFKLMLGGKIGVDLPVLKGGGSE